MVDPATLAAGAITKIAFDEFVKSGAGEVAKKTVGGAIDLVKSLRDKIRAKFHGDKKAETALAQVTQDGSPAALTKLEVYLDDAMAEDPTFAHDIRQVVQQIVNIQSQSISTRQYSNSGRDQINIENIQGNPRIGGA
jgi:hypothetical protein